MINWILNLLGIVTFFWVRFSNRKNKTKGNINYWLNDNWEEMVSIMLFNIIMMIILLLPATTVHLDEWIKQFVPFEVHVAIKPTMSALVGLLFSWIIYSLYHSKVKK